MTTNKLFNNLSNPNKYLILFFSLISIFLFAGNGKPKKNKYERDTTLLRNHVASLEFAKIYFGEDSLFTPEQMREDVLFFYEKIQQTHPNPYHVLSKDSLDEKVRQILESLDKPMNRREFWLKIAVLNAYFDAHTTILNVIELSNYQKTNSNIKIGNLILSDYSKNLYFNPEYKDSLLAGKQIKSINNIPAYQIVETFSAYYSHENKNRLSQLFAHHLNLLYSNIFGNVDSLQIEYLKNDNELAIHTLYPPDTSKKTISATPTQYEWKAIRFNLYEEESIAVIEINTSTPERLSKHYREDLDTIMATVIAKNIQYLFIDVSRNGGGNSDYANEILNFIKTNENYYYSASAEIKISPSYRTRMAPNLSLYNKKSLKSIGYYNPDGSIMKYDYYWTKNNASIQYDRNLYLIQSMAGTHSAAISLASLVKAYKFGTIIGEETGGLTACYIDVMCYIMPNASIPFWCSHKKVTDVGGIWGKGVIPDVEYKIGNPFGKSFTLAELKEMLQLAEQYKTNKK